jgi:hypothetical protein
MIGFSWIVVGQGDFSWYFIGLEETTQKGDGSLSLPVSVLLREAVVTYCLVSGVGLLWRLCLLACRVLGYYDQPALLCTGYVHDGSGTERMCIAMDNGDHTGNSHLIVALLSLYHMPT